MKQSSEGTIVWRHDATGIAQARLNATPGQLVDLWPHVKAVRAPTLLLRGARSDFLSAQTAEEMARRNRNITCRVIADASHYVHDDNFESFQSELDAFLNGAELAEWAAGVRA
jgi:pimeloyl-ACP methyl ester carboxylesterase